MEKTEVEQNPNFLRAKAMLAGSIVTPEYLINLWHLCADFPVKDCPPPEKCTPWDLGLEHLTTLR